MANRNPSLPLLQRLTYFLLRVLSWIGPGIFYRRRRVLGREHLRFDGPAIVIANHPSTLTDVMNVGLPIPREMFFLANYGLFRHPVGNWFFRLLFCIPVKRREDVAEGEARNNDAAFEQSFQHLEKGGVLFVAPEGNSYMHRIVRPFKTGTARIAGGAAARNNWALDVQIIPVGLTYSAPHLFRSDVIVQAGAPVHLRDWAAAWAADPEQAVDDLTAELESRVQALCVHTRDETGEQFITRLETVLDHSRPLSQEQTFRRSQWLTERFLDDAALEKITAEYFDSLRAAGLSDAGIAARDQPEIRIWAEAYFLALGFPIFGAGFACWFLPCFLPWLLNKKLNLYIGYSSTVKILSGLITFPLALWAAFRLGNDYLENQWFAGLFVGLMIACGLFAERYLDTARHFFARWRANRLAARKPEIIRDLVETRQQILAGIDAASFQKPQPAMIEESGSN